MRIRIKREEYFELDTDFETIEEVKEYFNRHHLSTATDNVAEYIGCYYFIEDASNFLNHSYVQIED